MKTLRRLGFVVMVCMCTGMICKSQHADVTVAVKGIREAKGKILIAAGDKSKPQEMKYGMVDVTSTDDVVYVLKDVPVGKCTLSLFQDMNGDYQLDMDENQIPVEPCYTKEKVDIKEGVNRIEIKLINVKELMRKKE